MKSRSIRWRLVALLLGSLVLVWVAMLGFGYVELREEVDELADARMEQSARTLQLLDLKRLNALTGTENNNDDERKDHKNRKKEHPADDDHARYVDFQVWSSDGTLLLGAPGAPDAAYDPHEGHATLDLDSGTWRSYAIRNPKHGYLVRVFEPTTTRSHLVNKIGLRMGQLLLFALPVLALLVWISIGRGLAPLTAMSRAIASRGAANLQPLALERIPAEVQPLVDSLNNLLARLADSLDRERAFTADAAHELRTPLAAIKVHAEVALGATDEEQRRRAIAQVIAGVQRTTHLVQQLLMLARIDHAQPREGQSVELGNAAIESAARYAGKAEQEGIELEVEAQPGCAICCDPAAASILIDNLLDNAIKYGRRGGHVLVAVARDHDRVVLSVKDDGPGVDPEHRVRLVDRFFRVEGSEVEGSGLGLSIVERVARRYRGTVDIGEGIDGRGLGVTIRFPAG